MRTEVIEPPGGGRKGIEMEKKEKLLRAMSLADDDLVEEANPTKIKLRKKKSWRRIGVVAACITVLAAAAALWLFLPYNLNPPSVAKYADSEYYEVIQKLNAATYVKPSDKNNYEKYIKDILNAYTDLKGGMSNGADMMPDMAPGEDLDYELGVDDGVAMPDAPEGDGMPGETYEEITDNQVQGVIEADRIKRSDKYIYYLDGEVLRVYSIEGADSKKVGTYVVTDSEIMMSPYIDEWEFYLSKDCKTVTVVASYYSRDKVACVSLIALDVTDPADITRKSMATITGAYLSSRVVDDKVLLMTQFRVMSDFDFSDETTFLPQIDTGNGFESIPAEGIVLPEELTSTKYTVVSVFDENDLTMKGVSAFLSYSEEIYVSNETIYATRTFTDQKSENGWVTRQQMTEITGVSYAGETLEKLGSITVEGYVKDQYSLDEYEGILRVVTTTDATRYRDYQSEYNDEDVLAEIDGWNNGTSANLYCISLNDWQIAAQVLQFAPKGEIVRSVRFDKEMAYVCTSVELTDPVFFFDLSDLSNITVKDTGTIEGFSSSLVNFGNGYLLGIGTGSNWGTLKLEIYEESENGVESVCAYELPNTEYATEYKSYYIDRQNQFVGLGIYSYGENKYTGSEYLLVLFDGYQLVELVRAPLDGQLNDMRAVYIDGYFYMFGADMFAVEKIGGE